MGWIVLFDQDSKGWVGQSLTRFIQNMSERKEREGPKPANFSKKFIFKRTPEMMPPQGCADSNQMPKLPAFRELTVGPDKSTTVCRLVLISQNPSGFAALLKSTQTDGKRIIHFSWAHKSGSESNSREAKGRAHGLGDPPILPQRPLSELCGSAGRMQVGKMQVMLLSVLRVSVRRMHWFIFTWFSIQPLSRGQNKECVIISLQNKPFA